MKPSLHSLIHLLSFLLNHLRLPCPELDPILDNISNFTAHSTNEHFFITTLHGLRRKHSLYCKGGVFTDTLTSSGHPIVAPVCFLGNVFTESLPSNGYTCHNIEMGLVPGNGLVMKMFLRRNTSRFHFRQVLNIVSWICSIRGSYKIPASLSSHYFC
jgi:hypothetical protein